MWYIDIPIGKTPIHIKNKKNHCVTGMLLGKLTVECILVIRI